VAEFQSLVLFLIAVIVCTAYILGKFVDHQEVISKGNLYEGFGKSKTNNFTQTEIMKTQSMQLVQQELNNRRIINQTVKTMMALQNKNNLEEMEVYDIKTGQKIKYYKENS